MAPKKLDPSQLVKAKPFKAPESEEELRGMALYNQNCRLCHDPRLFKLKSPLRLPSAASNLTGLFEPPRSRSAEAVKASIMNGYPTLMPSFRNSFSDEEYAALIAYIKTL
ncbi:cytochrome c [Pseudomaricurvus alkylphenolicus]|nr:cytochrome c [Pseudomaricurvus alkylphenolicus]